MKKILSLVLALTLLLSLCAPSMAEEKISLTFTNFYTEEDIANNADANARHYALMKFIEDNKDKYDITLNVMTQTDMHVKVQAQAAANDLPDLFLCKGSWLENFTDNELLADLTPYYENIPWKDDFYPGEFKSITRDGKIYGVPIQFVSATSLMFSNTAIWAEAGYDEIPTTFEQVFEAAEKINALGKTTIVLGNKDIWPYESCWISCLGDRFTGTEWFESILARDGVAKFTDENFVKMLEFTKELGQSGVLNPDFNAMTHDESIAAYKTGKAASLIAGYWAVGNILGSGDPDVVENTVITLLPQPQGAEVGDPNSLSNSSGWFVSVSSKLTGEKLDAAAQMAFEVNGPSFVDYLAENFGQLGPIKAEIPADGNFDKLQLAYNELAGKYAESGVPVYDVELNGAIVDVMNSGLQEVLAGTMEPQTLAELIQAEQDDLS